ncbi:MAG: flavodoxin domain-containing protein [Luteimonas sp.]
MSSASIASTATATPPRAWLGNALALLALLALAIALVPLHGDDWWPGAPQRQRWIAAAITCLAYAGLCALIARRARRGNTPMIEIAAANGDAMVVAYASQTGFAQALAERTAKTLSAAGVTAHCRDLGRIDAALLAVTPRMLFVVSTTGEGDPPDHVVAFVRDVLDGSAALPGLHYAVLALGDRTYAHYCGFGHRLDGWLRRSGATPLCDLVEVDNGDAGALRHWQHHLGRIADAPELPDWTPAAFDDWTLHARREANLGSVGGAAFHVVLQPPAASPASWQAGDIAEIGPRNTPQAIAATLARFGLPADAQVSIDARSQALRDVLARSHLPDAADSDDGVMPADAQTLVDRLAALPHREYSIASLPADGAVHLLVRRMRRADGGAGLGSGWLCDAASVGDTIAMRIRRNANFHPPEHDRPMILIGNGTGIAGLRAHLKARAAMGARRNWLLFGERSAAHDDFYRDDIARWQGDGVLERVDLVYSRDQPERRYVQHALREAADALRAWVDDGAAIYVCGSLQGMAPAVDAVLRDALGDARIDDLLATRRYRRDVY